MAPIIQGDIWPETSAQGGGHPVRVLIVDANAFRRSCTLASLSDLPDLTVAASDAIDGLRVQIVPDVVLFQDDRSGVAHIVKLLREAKQRWADAILVVVSNQAELIAADCVHFGAQIVLASRTGLESIVDAIRLAHKGMAAIPADALVLFRRASDIDPGTTRGSGLPGHTRFRAHSVKHLTRRQRDVLTALAMGLPNKEIARQLEISESTVKVHIRALMEATGASNRTQLVAHFLTGH